MLYPVLLSRFFSDFPLLLYAQIPPPLLSRTYQVLSDGTAAAMQARKVSYVAFPFPLRQLLVLLLVVFTIIAPMCIAAFMSNEALVGVLSFFVCLGYNALNESAAELEHPFGLGANHLQLTAYQRQVRTGAGPATPPLVPLTPNWPPLVSAVQLEARAPPRPDHPAARVYSKGGGATTQGQHGPARLHDACSAQRCHRARRSAGAGAAPAACEGRKRPSDLRRMNPKCTAQQSRGGVGRGAWGRSRHTSLYTFSHTQQRL